jgi:DNA recombination protein RmuC
MSFDLLHVLLLLLTAAATVFAVVARQGAAPQLARLGAELAAAREERARDAAEHEKALSALRADHAGQTGALKAERDAAQAQAQAAERQLEAQGAALREKVAAFDREREQFEKLQAESAARFKAIADAALVESQKKFVELADETFKKHQEGAKGDLGVLLKPIQETIGQFREKVDAIEKVRSEDRARLDQQIKQVVEVSQQTQETASKLAGALTSTRGAGRWGEETLRNVLEIAGLSPHCDFVVQSTASTETGRIRPDVIINMPGGGCLVVDAKVSLEDYLAAAEEADPQRRRQRLVQHAGRVKAHVTNLSRKDYWKDVPASVDFVVMFLPGENFYSAVLEHDREIFEYAWRCNVMIATPSTLIALAKSVAFGWRQEAMARHAQEAAMLGKQLYDRLATMSDHMNKVGGGLGAATRAYNEMVGSFESRVLVSARRFEELSIADGASLSAPAQVDLAPRQLQLLDERAAIPAALPAGPAAGASRRKQ